MLIRRFVIQESADRLVGKLLATLTRHLTHAFPGTQDGAGCQEKNQGRRSRVKFFLDISFHRTLSPDSPEGGEGVKSSVTFPFKGEISRSSS